MFRHMQRWDGKTIEGYMRQRPSLNNIAYEEMRGRGEEKGLTEGWICAEGVRWKWKSLGMGKYQKIVPIERSDPQ